MNEAGRVMLVLSESTHLEPWIGLASKVACERTVILRGVVTIPADLSLTEGTTLARKFRDALASAARPFANIHDEIGVLVDYRPMERIIDEIEVLAPDLVLVQWRGPALPTGGVETDELLRDAACDVILVSGESWTDDGPVLLPLRGGPNMTLGLGIAKALAGESTITLFHAADNRYSSPDLRVLSKIDPQIGRVLTSYSGLVDDVLREAVWHKAIVMGAPFNRPESGLTTSGPHINRVFEGTRTPLIVVRAWQPESRYFYIPRARRSKAKEELSTAVDRWFAENTFHSHEFADLGDLMALKLKQGLTISLGLPALNEAETVGTVISTLKRALMDEVPLLDEIVLIDSDSTDATVAIARDLGIPAFKHPEILPEVGMERGKGEALWKSLHVLHGDIVVWVDTDITNIHPRFVYGLLGPLLKHPQVQYVKGFYQRPIKVGDQWQMSGGGRVTELVARPLLNLFYPELSGIVQPLSGEYAGRRAALEAVPFFSGYGVETGLLLDLHERHGLNAIAQCDLEERVHHNQPLVGLSKMSFAILQVFIARLEERLGVSLLDFANRSMKLIDQGDDHFTLDIVEIGDVERPPMVSIPAYNEARKRLTVR
ncbi:MAG TPA: glucosyl-3-phosphoglycerate synthase [Aggregatilineales bacterium]|nr:glucosyl-3-phosphoglycerate synthase [Aggregatilineales bacterium]